MDKFLIRGGNRLEGEVAISGMKNSALPIIFGTICAADVCVIENLPDVSDIALSLETLRSVGAKIRFINTSSVMIDTTEVTMKRPPLEYVSKIRGSTYLLGAMLGRFGKAQIGTPGGCDFGTRPIDLHIKGFEALGAKTSYEDNASISFSTPNGLHGNLFYLNIASVGATINIMLAAVFAEGITVIENAAREPHVVDTACFLNACGAKIFGAGTNMIRIEGVEKLHGCTYSIAPDMIEAGTFMVAAAATRGKVTLKNVIPKHLDSVTQNLIKIGARIEQGSNTITVSADGKFNSVEINTCTYPGFPTDMHPQFSALLCLAETGMSMVCEGIWKGRFKYTEELKKMGAEIQVADTTAHIYPTGKLTGAEVKASDLRAGACLVIAGLCAEGQTIISGVEYIDRGYEHFVDKLRALGADIKRI